MTDLARRVMADHVAALAALVRDREPATVCAMLEDLETRLREGRVPDEVDERRLQEVWSRYERELRELEQPGSW